jgi:hypothetical protein
VREDRLDVDPFLDQLWPADFDQADVVGPGLEAKLLEQVGVQLPRLAYRSFAGITPADFN